MLLFRTNATEKTPPSISIFLFAKKLVALFDEPYRKHRCFIVVHYASSWSGLKVRRRKKHVFCCTIYVYLYMHISIFIAATIDDVHLKAVHEKFVSGMYHSGHNLNYLIPMSDEPENYSGTHHSIHRAKVLIKSKNENSFFPSLSLPFRCSCFANMPIMIQSSAHLRASVCAITYKR